MSLDDPQRLRDLVRYQRGELLREGLITKEEHADLLSNTPGAVKRLEGYDAMKASAETAEARAAKAEADLRDTLRDLAKADTGRVHAEAQCAAMRQALVEAFESTRAPTAQASTKQTASERDETYGLLCGARNRMLDALNASGAGAALLVERDRLREALRRAVKGLESAQGRLPLNVSCCVGDFSDGMIRHSPDCVPMDVVEALRAARSALGIP